jgi:hypothetical protein
MVNVISPCAYLRLVKYSMYIYCTKCLDGKVLMYKISFRI